MNNSQVTKNNYKVGIIGAGPAGLTAGYLLAKEGADVTIFEASDVVGGLARSFDLWNQRVDVGPHRFFSKDPYVNKLWKEALDDDYVLVDRLTRIYYDKKFFNYPLKIFNVLTVLGPIESIKVVISYIKQKLFPIKEEDTLESWVVSRFGRRLFDIYFKSYNEKLWGIKCNEIDSDFVAQRISNLSFTEALKNAITGSRKAKTLVDQFFYPKNGAGEVYTRMAQKIKDNGGTILLEKPVKRVIKTNNKANGVETIDGNEYKFDYVISTMPLTLMVKALEDVPSTVMDNVNKLKFRSAILVYLRINSDQLFPDQWVYMHARDLKMGRVTNFRNWAPTLYGEEMDSILTLEYWCNPDDEFWNKSDEELSELASREIVESGLLKNEKVLDTYVYRIKRCYPIYSKGYKSYLKPVQDYLDTIEGLMPIGRDGSFKYNNQDHSILMGMRAADNILNNKDNSLWEINTDYEYQENAEISKLTE
ncbi:FAD-dependent oxidoreductase [Candidatus Dojkabacteria bacterium]|uniref:FAD-dependent oxidoreductase n=1 Tax=Candidatus Dojkabacteria bacterium TaxID=2099670 RepID=A0A955L5X6_9BACT|nr:FAD-dependent oxidoreductase [Candidatus Dojkabacteria bacterium]